MNANAILTGSYAYGKPHDKSDVDIAVLVEQQSLEAIVAACRAMNDLDTQTHVFEREDGPNESQTCEHSISVRLGRMNLILNSRQESFQLWVDGTEILRKARPVTRDHAIAVFERLRTERGL